MMRRRDFLAASAAIAGAAMADGRTGRPKAQPARVLRFVPQADLAVVDPHGTPAYVTRNHAMMVFDTLYGVDRANRPQPQMVEGHVVGDDGRSWTLTLRPGLRFHDGEPVGARDVTASLKRWMAKDGFGFALADVLDELSAPDDRTILFRLKRPFPILPDLLGKMASYSTGIMPERLAKTDPTTMLTEIVGSGPYRFVASERVPGALNVYERFAGYQSRQEAPDNLAGGKVAHFDRVEWRTIPDPATAAAALQAGEVDWWEQPTPDLLPLLAGRDIKVEVKDRTGNVGILRFNCLHKPFDDPAVRKIVLQAVDQTDFMLAAAGENRDYWSVPVGYFHPRSVLASTEGLEGFARKPDYEKAKRELAAAGYKGEPIVLLSTADYPVIGAFGEVAADLFRKIGLNVDLQVRDWGTIAARMKNRAKPADGGYHAYCNFAAGAGMFNTAAHTYLRSNGDKAFDGWPDIPEIEALRAQWLTATDAAAQAGIGRRIQAIALEKVPYVPLGMFFFPTAYRANLSGIIDSMPLFWNVRRD